MHSKKIYPPLKKNLHPKKYLYGLLLTASLVIVGKVSSLEISPSELILKVKMSGSSVACSPLPEPLPSDGVS